MEAKYRQLVREASKKDATLQRRMEIRDELKRLRRAEKRLKQVVDITGVDRLADNYNNPYYK